MMATAVMIVLLFVLAFLPAAIGQAKKKAPFTGILSNSKGINRLSLARLALFAARDVWFVSICRRERIVMGRGRPRRGCRHWRNVLAAGYDRS